jgi:YYY domain-containing protein
MTQFFPNLVSWYIVALIAGFLGLPWTFRLFGRLPDRGYVFSKILGLLLATYLFWMMGSLGLVKNDNSGLVLGAILVGSVGYLRLGREGWADLKRWLGSHRDTVFAVEMFFLVSFIGWAWVRAQNPDIYGTEKPMEFMFLNSILRSASLPPQDAWLSGHAISYYYFGYFQMAALARLTGTEMSVAYNLAHALIFALTALGGLGLVMNLVGLVRADRARAQNQPAPDLLNSFWPGLLAPVLVLLVGNFYAPLELLHNNGILAQTQVPMVWYSAGQGSDAGTAAPEGIKAGSINLWDWLDLKGLSAPGPAQSAQFNWSLPNWFFASRVIHDRNLFGQETEAIDEMPAFSFLLADLHPHVLALPFVFLAIALALDWLLYAHAAALSSGGLAWPGWERVLFTSIVLGSLIFLNTWDFPIYWFLTLAAVIAGCALVLGRRALDLRWTFLTLALAWLGFSLALYFPFLLTFQSQAGGILPNLVYPSRFQQTLVMFGPVLVGVFVLAIWLRQKSRLAFDQKAAWIAGVGIVVALAAVCALLSIPLVLRNGVAAVLEIPAALSPAAIWSLFIQRRVIDSLTTIFAAVMIALPIGILFGAIRKVSASHEAALAADNEMAPEGAASFLQPEAPAAGGAAIWMVLLMIVTGSLLLIGPEFVYLRDNFGTRMNTLFKFYFQIWVLWGSASAFGIWYLFQYANRLGRIVVGVVMGAAVLAAAVYLPVGLDTKTGGLKSQATLDGMAYFARDYASDWAAIEWLQQHVSGSPVILEGTKGAYWIDGRSSRFSMATGLPTLMGWVNHEGQWRGTAFSQVASREGDIRLVYQTRDAKVAEELLNRYNVEYVIVSSMEQDWYRPIFPQKFEQILHPVFQSGDVTIYQR